MGTSGVGNGFSVSMSGVEKWAQVVLDKWCWKWEIFSEYEWC